MSGGQPYLERLLCFGPGARPRAGIDRVRRSHEAAGASVADPGVATGGVRNGREDAGDRMLERDPDTGLDLAIVCDRPAATPAEGVGGDPRGATEAARPQSGTAHGDSAGDGWGTDGTWLTARPPGEAPGHLIGTLTLPRMPLGPRRGVAVGAPGILLLNAGILPRGGPHRFNVKLARRLAARGLPVLRFDLSGHGDSGPAPGTLGYHEQTLADIGSAVDALCELGGVERVVIVGICSGAQAGWHAALDDARIVGLAMLDGHAYPSALTWLLHRWQRMRARDLPEQVAVLGGALGRGARRVGRRLFGEGWRQVFDRRAPEPEARVEQATQPGLGAADRLPVQLRSQDEYAEGMTRLHERGVRALIVYSCGWMSFYSYAAQYRHVFGRHAFAREVRLLFAPELDHTLTLVESQDTVSGWIEDWLAQTGLTAPDKEG